MNIVEEAYKNWRAQYKLMLRTFSDEQMFQFGFETANGVNEVMQEVVANLEAQVKELTERLAKLDKPKKTNKQEEKQNV